MHVSTNRVKLVIGQPKAFSPIHQTNSSSRMMFINSSMALCMFNGLRRQMAKEESSMVHLEFDPDNKHCTFLHATGHCPMPTYCAKGGTWDNCQVTREWNYSNPT
jgi:hypothetical protein